MAHSIFSPLYGDIPLNVKYTEIHVLWESALFLSKLKITLYYDAQNLSTLYSVQCTVLWEIFEG